MITRFEPHFGASPAGCSVLTNLGSGLQNFGPHARSTQPQSATSAPTQLPRFTVSVMMISRHLSRLLPRKPLAASPLRISPLARFQSTDASSTSAAEPVGSFVNPFTPPADREEKGFAM